MSMNIWNNPPKGLFQYIHAIHNLIFVLNSLNLTQKTILLPPFWAGDGQVTPK